MAAFVVQMEVIVGDFGIVVVPRDGTDTERIMNHSSVLRKHKVKTKPTVSASLDRIYKCIVVVGNALLRFAVVCYYVTFSNDLSCLLFCVLT